MQIKRFIPKAIISELIDYTFTEIRTENEEVQFIFPDEDGNELILDIEFKSNHINLDLFDVCFNQNFPVEDIEARESFMGEVYEIIEEVRIGIDRFNNRI